jgi:branched-chain amino acid transport system permease protein
MSVALAFNILINVSLLVILCIGFTFTFMMEKFPNFAHTSYASIGTVVAFYLVRFWGFSPYQTWPVAVLVCGSLGVLLYVCVVRPIKAQGMREITLTFTFYIMSQMISMALAIFSYWLLVSEGIQSSGFILRNYDFRVNDLPGIGLVAPVTVLLLVAALNVFLYVSRFGIAMRATAEDEFLAASLGVNIHHVHVASWFISGALAGLAGAIIPLWIGTSINYSDILLVNVMAGSVLGGLGSLTGAIVGGFLVASAKKSLTYVLMRVLGTWVGGYEELIPIVFLFTILAIEPNGITAIKWREVSVHGVEDSLRKLRETLRNLLTAE